MRKISIVLGLALILFSADVNAQESYILGDGSTIKVDGSSNGSASLQLWHSLKICLITLRLISAS